MSSSFPHVFRLFFRDYRGLFRLVHTVRRGHERTRTYATLTIFCHPPAETEVLLKNGAIWSIIRYAIESD